MLWIWRGLLSVENFVDQITLSKTRACTARLWWTELTPGLCLADSLCQRNRAPYRAPFYPQTHGNTGSWSSKENPNSRNTGSCAPSPPVHSVIMKTVIMHNLESSVTLGSRLEAEERSCRWQQSAWGEVGRKKRGLEPEGRASSPTASWPLPARVIFSETQSPAMWYNKQDSIYLFRPSP